MDRYTKTSSVSSENQDKNEAGNIYVKSGSKIRNIISQAHKILQNKEERKINLIGSGKSISKTITCAEIVKRRARGLYQLNALYYTKVEDTWEPKEESLDKYQAPGKSKSPVQFGDEDWELSWEDDPAKEPKKTPNGHVAKVSRSVTNGKKNEGADAQSLKNNESPLEKGASLGPSQEGTCENPKAHLNGADLKTEQDQSERKDSSKSQTTPKRSKKHRDQSAPKPESSTHKKQKSDSS
ncbi:uncharacterized protein LOC141881973 isoform X2 [Acropora palmata]|uniref:uncharacterized protein LOC141881973 isoform X2 n=1 Tax=Acropora palmata TaxID=6131 RepID=UPI003DA0EB09